MQSISVSITTNVYPLAILCIHYILCAPETVNDYIEHIAIWINDDHFTHDNFNTFFKQTIGAFIEEFIWHGTF